LIRQFGGFYFLFFYDILGEDKLKPKLNIRGGESMSRSNDMDRSYSPPLDGGGGVIENLKMKLESLRPGDHICWIYENDEDFDSLIVFIITQGIEKGERVIYIDKREKIERVKRLLTERITLEEFVKKGQILFLPPEEVYLKFGVFESNRVIEFFEREVENSLFKEYPCLRVIGSMDWVIEKSVLIEALKDYEMKINRFSFLNRILGICLYDKRLFSSDVLLFAFQSHPKVIIEKDVYENFYYIPPEELLKEREEATLKRWIENLKNERRLKEEIEESQNLYKTIFEDTGTATVIIEEDTTISLVNREFEKLTGYTKEEIEGKMSWQQFVAGKEDLEKMREYHRLRRVESQLAPRHYEFKLSDRSGNIKDIWLTIDMIPGTKRSIASLLDITELKKTNRLLRMLYETNQAMIRTKTEEELRDSVLKIINKYGGYKESSIGTPERQDENFISIPLDSKDASIGALNIYQEPNLSEAEKNILKELVQDLKYGISSLRLEKINRELNEALRISEEKYRTIFKNAPIALLEEDFFEIKKYLDRLKASGIDDLEAFFDANPEELKRCISLIRVIDVNNEAMAVAKAREEKEVIDNICEFTPEGTFIEFKKVVIDMYRGINQGEFESIGYNLLGEELDLYIKWFILPKRKKTLERIITAVIDITERKLLERKLRESLDVLRKSFNETVEVLSSVVEMKDPYTAGHQRRVSELACRIGEKMNLDEDTIDTIRIAGLLHDIGKISVPGEMLNKPGKLSKLEFNIVKLHPQLGYSIIKDVDFLSNVALVVLQHQERLDGSGYPGGLKDGEILLEAKILAVADVVEAMISHRPYRPAHTLEEALDEIRKNKGKLYDPEVVDACIEVFEEGFKFSE